MVYVYGELPPVAEAVNVTVRPTWGDDEETCKLVERGGGVVGVLGVELGGGWGRGGGCFAGLFFQKDWWAVIGWGREGGVSGACLSDTDMEPRDRCSDS